MYANETKTWCLLLNEHQILGDYNLRYDIEREIVLFRRMLALFIKKSRIFGLIWDLTVIVLLTG